MITTQLEGVIFFLAAIVAVLEIPHGFHLCLRWLRYRLRFISRYPRLHRYIFVTTVLVTFIIIPVHAVALALEASHYWS